jgi:hypothetical protein
MGQYIKCESRPPGTVTPLTLHRTADVRGWHGTHKYQSLQSVSGYDSRQLFSEFGTTSVQGDYVGGPRGYMGRVQQWQMVSESRRCMYRPCCGGVARLCRHWPDRIVTLPLANAHQLRQRGYRGQAWGDGIRHCEYRCMTALHIPDSTRTYTRAGGSHSPGIAFAELPEAETNSQGSCRLDTPWCQKRGADVPNQHNESEAE